jgi:dihydrofolate reductase
LDDVLEHHGYKRRLFVIGGADVYQQALSYDCNTSSAPAA